ncbi:FKBP-type peptidyl-prolyl cis-trans isomerase [Goodfellowiella coeruleoviolacea]|uniref:Peptidyl-prolyl cis-trans isomerase n=1 Tax=Goodfellowiella coeruleoviolacea TaxID=334858 RepID=A0AAE3GME2_9PSEU|nr:FKBP-type peptidyl-prolyl cis-trans isomerase [Goodfellowiella coeruleoviolacea]MCP2170250.1 peptidylprolyl isomerase [Goodfellowiella coeruleoviolacea]
MRRPLRAGFVLMAALSLSLTACGGSGNTNSGTSASPTAKSSSAAQKPPCTVDAVKVSGAAGQKPVITIPDNCSPPQQMLTADLTAGSDPAVKQGDHVEANYVLVTWSNKKEVDSSWESSPPKPLALDNIGQASVIPAWNEGLIGMKQGGRRLLVVPPAKGYGEKGTGPIKGNETLVFVVDMAKVGA